MCKTAFNSMKLINMHTESWSKPFRPTYDIKAIIPVELGVTTHNAEQHYNLAIIKLQHNLLECVTAMCK